MEMKLKWTHGTNNGIIMKAHTTYLYYYILIN